MGWKASCATRHAVTSALVAVAAVGALPTKVESAPSDKKLRNYVILTPRADQVQKIDAVSR